MPKTKEKSRLTLLEATIELLRHRRCTLTLDQIAKDIGCSRGMLASLISPDPPVNPGVNTIQTLYEYLSGTVLTYGSDNATGSNTE